MGEKQTSSEARQPWVQILAFPPTSCIISGKAFSSSEPVSFINVVTLHLR